MIASGGDAVSLVVWLIAIAVLAWGFAPYLRDWKRNRDAENKRT